MKMVTPTRTSKARRCRIIGRHTIPSERKKDVFVG